MTVDKAENPLNIGDLVIFMVQDPSMLLYGVVSMMDSNGWFNVDYFDPEGKIEANDDDRRTDYSTQSNNVLRILIHQVNPEMKNKLMELTKTIKKELGMR